LDRQDRHQRITSLMNWYNDTADQQKVQYACQTKLSAGMIIIRLGIAEYFLATKPITKPIPAIEENLK